MNLQRKSSLSPNAKVFVPGQWWKPPGSGPGPGGDAAPPPGHMYTIEAGTGGPDDHINFVQDTIYQMSISPGNFEEYMRSLVDMLNTTLTEAKQVEDVANIVFDQSVLEPNFTYTGAKMCEYLHKHLKLKDTDFRKQINRRAKDICVNRAIMVKHPEDVHRLRGATTFLTELFLNSEVTIDGQTKKIDVYRKAQQEMMETLSSNPDTDNYKCLGQIFKLAGKLIEDYDKEQEKSKLSSKITKVFNNAKNVVVNASIDKDVRQMWLQLIERRACDWGRVKTSPLVATKEPVASSQSAGAAAAADADAPFTNEPVFFSADGKIITAAEAGFSNVDFESEYENFGPGDMDQYIDDDADDYRHLEEAIAAVTLGPGGDAHDYDDWDPEVEAAFEQFQQESSYYGGYR